MHLCRHFFCMFLFIGHPATLCGFHVCHSSITGLAKASASAMTKAEAAVKAVAGQRSSGWCFHNSCESRRRARGFRKPPRKPALPQGRHCSPNLSEFLISEDSLRSHLPCAACLVRRRIVERMHASSIHACCVMYVRCAMSYKCRRMAALIRFLARSALIDAAVLGSDGVRLRTRHMPYGTLRTRRFKVCGV